jgi:hypothetical protein
MRGGPMTADSIRKLIADHLQGRIDGSLDPENTRNLFLAEIAAQLAELNQGTAAGQMLKNIEGIAMRTCNSERDLAVTLESIRHLFYEKQKENYRA